MPTAYSEPMSLPEPSTPAVAAHQDDSPPWWGNLAVALVLTFAAASAGLFAASIA